MIPEGDHISDRKASNSKDMEGTRVAVGGTQGSEAERALHISEEGVWIISFVSLKGFLAGETYGQI